MEKTPLDENWEVAYWFENVRGRPVVYEMKISLRDGREIPDGGLTGRDLRRLSPLLAAAAEGTQETTGPEAEALLEAIADEFRGSETIGKGYPRPDSFYARVAQLYLLALQRSPRKPADFMAAEMVRRGVDVTVQMTRAWIRMARARGWLEGGDQGSPGAEPGEKLLAWKEEEATIKESARREAPARPPADKPAKPVSSEEEAANKERYAKLMKELNDPSATTDEVDGQDADEPVASASEMPTPGLKYTLNRGGSQTASKKAPRKARAKK